MLVAASFSPSFSVSIPGLWAPGNRVLSLVPEESLCVLGKQTMIYPVKFPVGHWCHSETGHAAMASCRCSTWQQDRLECPVWAPTRCGARGHGSVWAWQGWGNGWLDSMILKVFPSLNESTKEHLLIELLFWLEQAHLSFCASFCF